jgi:hypothetical protein
VPASLQGLGCCGPFLLAGATPPFRPAHQLQPLPPSPAAPTHLVPIAPQAVQPIVALRTHLHSLSRRVLVGHGHYDGLPIDLFLGGLSPELAVLLKEAPPPDAATAAAAAAGAGGPTMAAAAAALAALPWGPPPVHCGPLPQGVLDFFTVTLPLPQMAVLVFAEFVGVDVAPQAPGTPSGGSALPMPATGSDGACPWEGPQGAAAWPALGSNVGGGVRRAGGSTGSHPPTSPRRAGDRYSTHSTSGNGCGSGPSGGGVGGGDSPITFEAATLAAAAAVKALAADLSRGAGRR